MATLLDSPRLAMRHQSVASICEALKRAYPTQESAIRVLRFVVEPYLIHVTGAAEEFWPTIVERLIRLGLLRTLLDQVEQDDWSLGWREALAAARAKLDVQEADTMRRESHSHGLNGAATARHLCAVPQGSTLSSALDRAAVVALRALMERSPDQSLGTLRSIFRLQSCVRALIQELVRVELLPSDATALSGPAANSVRRVTDFAREFEAIVDRYLDALSTAEGMSQDSRGTRTEFTRSRFNLARSLEALLAELPSARAAS